MIIFFIYLTENIIKSLFFYFNDKYIVYEVMIKFKQTE